MVAARLRGLAEIAQALCVASRNTVLDYAARPFDPLPLRWLFGKAQIDRERLELWRRREAKDPTLPLLEGHQAIGHALGGKGRHAVARLIRRDWHPLPVMVAPDGSWSAYESALQDWISAEVEPGWRRTRRAGAEPREREQKKTAPAPRAKLKRAA